MGGIALLVLFTVFLLMSFFIISRSVHDLRADRAWQQAHAADVARQIEMAELKHTLDIAGLNARQALIRAALDAVREEDAAARE